MRFDRLLRICCGAALLCMPEFCQSDPPSLGYRFAPDWPTPALTAAGTPTAWNLIQVSGVAVDARGHVLVLHRGAHPILEFESSGKFVRSWGDGLFSEGKVVAVAACQTRAWRVGYRPSTTRAALPAARMPCASTKKETSGWSMLPARSSTR